MTRTPHHAAAIPTTSATAPAPTGEPPAAAGPQPTPAATATTPARPAPAAGPRGCGAAAAARRRRTNRRRTPRPSRGRSATSARPTHPPAPTVAGSAPSTTSVTRLRPPPLGAARRSAVRLTVVGTSVATSPPPRRPRPDAGDQLHGPARPRPASPSAGPATSGRTARPPARARPSGRSRRRDAPGWWRAAGRVGGAGFHGPEICRSPPPDRYFRWQVRSSGGSTCPMVWCRGWRGHEGDRSSGRLASAVGSLPHAHVDDAVELALGSQPLLPAHRRCPAGRRSRA